MKDVIVLEKKWVRSSDGIFGGVCEGLGKSFGLEPNLLRLIWLISVFIFGTGLFLYLVLTWTLPREDKLKDYNQSKFLGVCHRISNHYGVELGLVRLMAVFSFLASFGVSLLFYIGLFFFLPKENETIYL